MASVVISIGQNQRLERIDSAKVRSRLSMDRVSVISPATRNSAALTLCRRQTTRSPGP